MAWSAAVPVVSLCGADGTEHCDLITTQGLSVSPACLVLDLVLVLASYNEATIATPHASSTKVLFSARRVECTLPLVSTIWRTSHGDDALQSCC